MPHSEHHLFIHLVWSTYDRLPTLTQDYERDIHREICHQAVKLGCQPLEIGGMPDHVHLLVQLPTTLAIADLVQRLKSSSTLFAHDRLGLPSSFRWQGYYAAFTVSRWDVTKVREYIKKQKEHHSQGTHKAALEFLDSTVTAMPRQ